jgi:hypothetical protein
MLVAAIKAFVSIRRRLQGVSPSHSQMVALPLQSGPTL